MTSLTASLTERIGRLFADYGWLLDAERYEDWLELFGETASYRIVPRENVALGLPASLMWCRNKDMLRDRITTLQEVNEYDIYSARHIIGLPRFADPVRDIVSVETPFAVYHTDQEGVSRLFGVGEYQSKVSCAGARLLLETQVVVLDTFSVPTLLADPL
jgi:anthranilate 1,2-dioxygenase small subunit